MKKTLIALLAAALLTTVACNNADADRVEKANERAAMEQNDGDRAASKDSKKAAVKSDYQFTGDVNKDAEYVVKVQIEVSTKMLKGEKTDADDARFVALFDAASEYYGENGPGKAKAEEFKTVLGEKYKEALNKLAEVQAAEAANQ